MPRSSRSWCETADSLMPTSAAMSQTQSSPGASASRMRTRVGIAEDAEGVGQRFHGPRPHQRPPADGRIAHVEMRRGARVAGREAVAVSAECKSFEAIGYTEYMSNAHI